MSSGNFDIQVARSTEDIEIAGEMFREYQEWLDVDLCFQDFENELSTLPGKYAPPSGEIFIARQNGQVAGVVAIRPVDPQKFERSEMKRLYVREAFRGQGLGRILANTVVSLAKEAGYQVMVLDTLPHLKAAIKMYASMGFNETAPYYENPLPGVVYMEKIL